MRIDLHRIANDQDSTTGYIKINGEFECFTLEDEHRDQKVKGETRIPSGSYKLGLRTTESPLTMRYRKRFDWFKWHIQLLHVPNFNYVYLHIGNDDSHTDGCILLGDGIMNKGTKEDFLMSSTQAFERFYKKVFPVLESGSEPVTIYIYD